MSRRKIKKNTPKQPQIRKELCDRMLKSFGAWCVMLPFLTPVEQIYLQLLCLWTYRIGVSRAQPRIQMEKILYFPLGDQIYKFQCLKKTVTKLDSEISNNYQYSVQVAKHIFQVHYEDSSCRLLENIGSSKFKAIEKAPMKQARHRGAFCNMADQFIFASGGESRAKCLRSVERYDMARDLWEEMPEMIVPRTYHGSCTLSTTVYVICGYYVHDGYLNSVEKLETRNLETRWQLIQIPQTSLSPRADPVVAALNPSEILIMGGSNGLDNVIAEAVCFDTKTNSVKPAMRKAPLFQFFSTKSASMQVSHGVVIAIVLAYMKGYRIIEYRKSSIKTLITI